MLFNYVEDQEALYQPLSIFVSKYKEVEFKKPLVDSNEVFEPILSLVIVGFIQS